MEIYVGAQDSAAKVPETIDPPKTSAQGDPTPASVDVDQKAQKPVDNRIGSTKIYKGEKISLDFQNEDILNVLRIISEFSGKKMVISENVKGKVTLKLKDVPWDQALDIILLSKDLGLEESNNVLTVYDLPTFNRILNGRGYGSMEGQAINRTKLAPLTKKVFTPKYSSVSATAMEMEKAKSERGKIMTIGNDIYVEDDHSALAAMEQIFKRADKASRQILVEARIVEAKSTFEQSLDIKWSADYKKAAVFYDDSASDIGGTPDSLPGVSEQPEERSSDDGLAKLGFGFLNKAGSLLLNAQIGAAENVGDASTISSPRIMAANGMAIYIKQGQPICGYRTGSSADTPTDVPSRASVADMQIVVTPHVAENSPIVMLDITLTKDSPREASSSAEPALNQKEIKTKLMIKDGETVVLGGIIVESPNNADSNTKELRKIPLKCWLSEGEPCIANKGSELFIFINANVIPDKI